MKNKTALEEHIVNQFSHYEPDVPAHIWPNIIAGNSRRKPIGYWPRFLYGKGWFLLSAFGIVCGSIILYQITSAPPESNLAANSNQLTNGSNMTNAAPVAVKHPAAPVSKAEIIDPAINPAGGGNINRQNPMAAQTDASADITFGVQTKSSDVSSEINGGKRRQGKPRAKYVKGATFMSYNNPGTFSDEKENFAVADNSPSEAPLKRHILDFPLLTKEKNVDPVVNKIAIPELNIPCPGSEKDAAGNKRYLELYGGPDYAFRSITDTGNSMYMEKRKESARFSSAFSVGARYTRVFSNGMSFRTGFNYSQINEKFRYAQGNIIQVVYITNSNGDTTGSYTTSGTRYKTTFNKFRTMDVPLLIGYEFGNGRLHANINAGAMINIYSWQKGDVLDTAYQPVNITTGKTTSPYQFKTNAGIGFSGSFSVYYKLSRNMHFLAEPYFRYNFSPASKAELTLKQKYSTAGLRLGVRFDF